MALPIISKGAILIIFYILSLYESIKSVVGLAPGLFISEVAFWFGLEFCILKDVLGASMRELCLTGYWEGWLKALTFPELPQKRWSPVYCCWINSLFWMLVVRKAGCCEG